jgi:hypothetical protein
MDIRCVRLDAYDIGGNSYLDIEQVIPLPAAADYQIQVRRKEQAKEQALQSGADWTKYTITSPSGTSQPLYKRQAILRMIQSLVQRGVSIASVAALLPDRLCRVVSGELAYPAQVVGALVDIDVKEPARYFIESPFVEQGHTYVLSKMWGLNTEPTLKLLRDTFPEAQVTYAPV